MKHFIWGFCLGFLTPHLWGTWRYPDLDVLEYNALVVTSIIMGLVCGGIAWWIWS